MDDFIGDVLVTSSDWVADLATSPYFGPALGLVALVVLIGAVRLWRWLSDLDARDEQRKRDAIPVAGRPDDV